MQCEMLWLNIQYPCLLIILPYLLDYKVPHEIKNYDKYYLYSELSTTKKSSCKHIKINRNIAEQQSYMIDIFTKKSPRRHLCNIVLNFHPISLDKHQDLIDVLTKFTQKRKLIWKLD